MNKRYLDKTQTGLNAADATVAIADQRAIEVKNAQKITAIFTRAGHSSGSGAFAIHGSFDGVTYVALPLTSFIANTNAQTLTRALSVSLASNTSVLVVVENIFCGIRFIKLPYTETTDGTATAELVIEDELMS